MSSVHPECKGGEKCPAVMRNVHPECKGVENDHL